MPVPIPGLEVGSDSQKDEFFMISGRPKTGFFRHISGAPGYIPPIPASYQPRSLILGRLWHDSGLILGRLWVDSGGFICVSSAPAARFRYF